MRKIELIIRSEPIPVPDYSAIYSEVIKKTGRKYGYCFFIPFILGVILFLIFLPRNEIGNPFLDYSTIGDYYWEADCGLLADYEGYEEPYALYLDLDEPARDEVVNYLQKGLR